MTTHTVTPVGLPPVEVETEDGDCEFCEAVREHFKHERGVVFFEIPGHPDKVQRVAILLSWPLLLECQDINRTAMVQELAQ